jgi:glutathione S-transferase
MSELSVPSQALDAPAVHTQGEIMIRLSQPLPFCGLPSISPSCMKLETWLRIADIPYEIAPLDMSAAPKGKVPFIEDGGKKMGDSTLIIDYLKKTRGKDPDEGLTAAERAVSLAFRRMMKEEFYWVIIQCRYRDERNWSIYKNLFADQFPSLPEPQRHQIVASIYETTISQMQGHGMGRHTAEEVYQLGIADITAVSDFLANKPFFMGEKPTTADAAIYAYVASMIEPPLDCPVKEHGLKLINLVDYCKRMRARYYPELA